jgi:hypothetical protein
MVQKYATYLKEVHRLPERMILYYCKWVKEAYTTSKTSLKVPIPEETKNACLHYCGNRHDDSRVFGKEMRRVLRLPTSFVCLREHHSHRIKWIGECRWPLTPWNVTPSSSATFLHSQIPMVRFPRIQ